jgi:hypothetical protein
MKRFEQKKLNQTKLNQTKLIEHLTPSTIVYCPKPNNTIYKNSQFPECICADNTTKQTEYAVPYVIGADYKFKCT